ncbi:MAG: hypothetical protein WC414_01485 [Patescibacteria group bacterium]
MDKKKILYIILFITVCCLLAYAIYFVFFRKATTPEGGETGTTPGGNFPTVNEGGTKTGGESTGTLPETGEKPDTEDGKKPLETANEIINLQPTVNTQKSKETQVVNTKVANVSYSQNGAKFYNPQDGKFYFLNSEGKLELLSDKVFYNVENVTWSPTQNEGIIEYPDGSNIYYNFEEEKQVTLPKHWEDFDFSTDGGSIVSKSMAELADNRWLITSDPTGNNIELIESMGNNADKVIVDWSPNNQIIALSATGEASGNNQEILLVGLNNENYASLTVAGRGLETKWSPDGKRLLHSVYNSANNYKPELWISDATPETVGENRQPLGLNTWADKCAFSSDSRYIYCGVPTELRDGAGFAPEVANSIADSLYKIDLITGTKTKISLDETYTINTIIIDQNGKNLYFTDKNKNGIFKINL